jgi:hypothetical protein
MEKRIRYDMDDIIYYLNDTEKIIIDQGTFGTGSSSLNIEDIIEN